MILRKYACAKTLSFQWPGGRNSLERIYPRFRKKRCCTAVNDGANLICVLLGRWKEKEGTFGQNNGREPEENWGAAKENGESLLISQPFLRLSLNVSISQAEDRLKMIEDQMKIDQEKQKLKKKEEKRVKSEQKMILGKDNSRPKLSFGFANPV